jgi:hypothetical protein
MATLTSHEYKMLAVLSYCTCHQAFTMILFFLYLLPCFANNFAYLFCMKVFMGQKDLNKDFEQAAMCNSQDLKYVSGLFLSNSRELKRTQEIS